MQREIVRPTLPGIPALAALLLAVALAVWQLVAAARAENPPAALGWALALAVLGIAMAGLFTVQPNEAKVLTLFGDYVGTVRKPGLHWANPLYAKKRVSLRVRNFETAKLKVNDSHSNPIEIAAIAVWRVVDTAEALFEVDDYQNFVHTQSESALRSLALTYPYDAHSQGEVALSTHPEEIARSLQAAIQERLQRAGVEVIEARISHLAYAPEIAAAMLRRQQASAIIAARSKIVEGAVSMVENALDLIAAKGLAPLDDERRAAMVSNLLVVLCSDRDAQPVINTGTLYQ